MAVAIAIESSISRVRVMPMYTPSHVKAANPTIGISITQWKYSLDASITSVSPLRSVMIRSPHVKYRTVNITETPVPHHSNALILLSRRFLSRAPRQLPHRDSPANAKPSMK